MGAAWQARAASLCRRNAPRTRLALGIITAGSWRGRHPKSEFGAVLYAEQAKEESFGRPANLALRHCANAFVANLELHQVGALQSGPKPRSDDRRAHLSRTGENSGVRLGPANGADFHNVP